MHRYFSLFGLQPHRTETFKLSTDSLFNEKLRDVVGLYINPPENALVLCVGEKSQCQALRRKQPMLPVGLGSQGQGVAGCASPLAPAFISTYSSWLNQVERFLSIITNKAIRRGSFRSVKDLT